MLNLVGNSEESTRGTPQPVSSKNTRSAVRNRNSLTADESVETDMDSTSAQLLVGRKTQRGKKRALGSTKEQSVESKKNKPSKHADKNKDSTDDGEEWRVEAIMGSRKANKVREYLIKWEGEWVNTWEPVNNLTNCEDMVRGYEEKRKADKKAKYAARRKENAAKAKEERAKISLNAKPTAAVTASSFPAQLAIKPSISPSPKRTQRATTIESTFSVSKSPTPEPTLLHSFLRTTKVCI